MSSGNKFFIIACIVVVALIVQALFVIADQRDTPHDAAVKFAKAYFMLGEDMAEYLCSEITADEDTNVVNDYLWRVAAEARAEGYATSYMRMVLSHIDTKTQMVDDNTAEVHLTCNRRRSINLAFALVAKLFFLGDTYPVDETLTLIREDDRWKVCGQPFALIES